MTALTLAERGVHVTLITAGQSLFSGNTRLAQGGIVYKAVDDKPSDLVSDIVTAGWRRNHVKAVRHLAKHGPEILKKTLIDKYGVEFMRQNGDFRRIREGGHSKARILFCADHTGKSIMERLALAVEESPNISVLTGRTAIDLLTTHHHARSAWTSSSP